MKSISKSSAIPRETAYLFVIFIFSFILALPLFLHDSNVFFRLNTDYDSLFSHFEFIISYFQSNKILPTVNPFLMTGVPVIGDPNSYVLNPIAMVPIIIFGIERGYPIIVLLCFLLSGLSMYIFLRSIFINSSLSLWGSLLYVSAGNMVAYVSSGHLPELLVFPIIPVFYLVYIRKKLYVGDHIIGSLIFTYTFFSGYNYLLWLFAIILTFIRFYYFLQKENSLSDIASAYAYLLLFFTIFSSIKLIPFFVQVKPILVRYFPIDPYLGSLHLFLYPLGFLVPIQLNFYDRPFFRRIFGFNYNWHEFFVFISPFPLLFLFKIKKILKEHYAKIFLLILFIGSLYISLKYPYSPFYWVYKYSSFARNFRIPQRIYEPTTAVLIALCTLCAKEWFINPKRLNLKIGIIICIMSIICTFVVSFTSLFRVFEPSRKNEEEIVKKLRSADSTSYYAAVLSCCLQTYLVREKIPVINAYFAWRPKDSPNFVNPQGDNFNFDKFYEVKPRYILAPVNKDMSIYGYSPFIKNIVIQVWKTDIENIRPSI